MKKIILILLSLMFIVTSYAGEREDEFERQLSQLKSPKELMMENGFAKVRVGDEFILPYANKEIIPTDERETFSFNKKLKINNSNPEVVSVNEFGLVKALNIGVSRIQIEENNKTTDFVVEVGTDNAPLSIQNLVYIGKREFLSNQMHRLPKYNQYAKWYYKKKKEVGWCSVFASYCVNAAGLNTFKYNTINIDSVNKDYVFGLLEGQVGHQWDGYSSVNRFVDIPKPGYFVIYGNTKNAYKFTHIGLVVDVVNKGDGIYKITTVEGNMSNTVKCYSYLYDSKIKHPKKNISELPKSEQTNQLIQYKEHTGYWSVFGFCATWE